jgi:hypothetical protein
LLPQSLGVLPGEFAGYLVQVAEALDRDEEGLLVVESRGAAVGDLLPEVVLEFVDVRGGDRLVAEDVAAPAIDLAFQPCVGVHHAHASVAVGGKSCQTCRSVSATTVHCCCRSVSASSPEGVMA